MFQETAHFFVSILAGVFLKPEVFWHYRVLWHEFSISSEICDPIFPKLIFQYIYAEAVTNPTFLSDCKRICNRPRMYVLKNYFWKNCIRLFGNCWKLKPEYSIMQEKFQV